MSDMRTSERPQPAPTDLWAEYWDACGRGELLIQHCPACGARQFYPRLICTTCGSTPEWERASGRGTVYTYTVIRQNYAKPFRDLIPYVVAMIALDEGPMMMSNLTGCDTDDVTIGMPVEVWFDQGDEGVAVPYWRPAT